ncbi:aspartate--tRNA ligase [Blattabacterium cuenoti]|uniref:aspartate--tRNA ligase n=1 Tax=Blattabacterium cuenoti TaxID=1653831 RepID=UPI00163B7B01|nr:aspartate--tRNA ligase [Blattabacterium cuenoti]
MFYRTHNCGELTKKDLGKKVVLSGWIKNIRNLGSLCFLDLRDFFGIIQLFFSKKFIIKNKQDHIELGKEFLIQVEGEVVKRKSKNKKIPTGEIEILVSKLEILNFSLSPPFLIEEKTDGDEETRMKYRYLDIRRNSIKNNLILRHNISLEIRNYLSNNGFLEIETPILINETPEGARSFVVPYRNHKGLFYSLHQSPQLFKQLLMIGGIDKYFQIVKCFRDEDARSDRQIEFTQIDCEMSFVDMNDVLNFFEKFIKHLFKKIKNIQLEPFRCIPYTKSIQCYGTNSPDLRFEMEFIELNDFFLKKGIFSFQKEKLTIGIKVPNFAHYTCDKINSILKGIKELKINEKEIFWIKFLPNKKFFSSQKELFNNENCKIILQYFKAVPGDLLFIIHGKRKETREKMSKIRLEMTKILNVKNTKIYKPIWIIDLPLLEWNEKSKKFKSFHHPFTSPVKEDLHFLDEEKKENIENIRANSYELIINGVEIGGGSIRIHNKKIQKSIFKHLGYSEKEIEYEFGFFNKALEYGAPPHGGIAFGLDRLLAILEGNENIKNFIAFPKNNSGRDLMINTPSTLKNEKLKELNLK